jgi:hypothetical protein
MSQRRQEARRAKQERRREQRHQNRATVRRSAPAATTRPAATAAAPPQKTSFWTTRNKWIAAGGIAGVLVLIAAFFVYRSVTAPLPGEYFESQGNAHLSDINQPHEPYNSNPPTSGPHLPPVPRPGVYTQPKQPEELGHFMEHGGVWLLYNCSDGCEQDLSTLQDITNSAIDGGRPVALAPFPSMDTRFAVVAWQYLLTQDDLDRGKIDDFISRHACRYNPEGGPYCSGVRGTVKEGSGSRDMELPVTQQPFSVFGSPTPAPSGPPAASPTAAP